MKGNIDWSLAIATLALVGTAVSLLLQWAAHRREKRREERDQKRDLRITYKIGEHYESPKVLCYIIHLTFHNVGNQRVAINRLDLYEASTHNIVQKLEIAPDDIRVVNAGETVRYQRRFCVPMNKPIDAMINQDIYIKAVDIDGNEYLA